MRAAIFFYSRRGAEVAKKLIAAFPEWECEGYTVERIAQNGFSTIQKPTREFYGRIFNRADALIFIGACAIAVREIAPHIKDKTQDPAVICIDDLARFVIPILGGHIGGANRLAQSVSDALCATPVITTATDIRNKFSVDAWAAEMGFAIGSMELCKEVSARILEEDIPIVCDLPVISDYPNGITLKARGELGIYIGWKKKAPFERTLHIITKTLHLGIGCRKGVSAQAISAAVNAALDVHGIDRRAIKSVASIDIKINERGLLEYCRENGWEARFYSAEELNAVAGEFSASEFVRSVTGVSNVCERAAMVGADELLIGKIAQGGVCVAIAAEKTEVRFG